MSLSHRISEIEQLIRRDPGGRGLIGYDGSGPAAGSLNSAAACLAESATHVALVTGFFIPDAPPDSGQGAAETDGPPGTCLLARVLTDLGVSVRIVTDSECINVVRTAARVAGIDESCVLEAPLQSAAWRRHFLDSEFGRDLTHLIAVERVGPNHNPDSVHESGSFDDVLEFQQLVSDDLHDRCCNMRGLAIDEFTGDLHQLFGEATTGQSTPDGNGGSAVQTLGIGDGGNEIGMGQFAWRELYDRLPGESSACVPCRIATDHAIVAGTSNWGAQALAAGVCVLKDRIDLLEPHTVESQEQQLEQLVHEGGAVDGVTRQSEPTVDALPFMTYIQPWAGIRRLLGLPE